jgi:transposase
MANDARFVRADRQQTRWDFIDLEGLLPSDHRARIVVAFVGQLDLSRLYEAIKAREGEPGRPPPDPAVPPPDPAVLMALWLYATIEGVGSARQLERLAQSEVAYRWIAGGVPLNYHGLADFRVAHLEALDRLLTESVTARGDFAFGDCGRRHQSAGECRSGIVQDVRQAVADRGGGGATPWRAQGRGCQ